MKGKDLAINEIEKYILFTGSVKSVTPNAINLSQIEVTNKSKFSTDVKNIDFSSYVQSGDYHYFVSRQLFMKNIYEYSFFSAQQCIENYLKAYLKHKSFEPPNTHDLIKILQDCNTKPINIEDFMKGNIIKIIIEKFNPFNELARYPIQKIKPKDGQYFVLYPTDIKILDYFVFKMREILILDKNIRDVFLDSHYKLEDCLENHPDFYAIFKHDNINFEI